MRRRIRPVSGRSVHCAARAASLVAAIVVMVPIVAGRSFALQASAAAMSEQQALRPEPRAAPTPSASPAEQLLDEVEVDSATRARRVPPKAGDVCRVCNRPIASDDVVFMVRGHRVPIHLGELDGNLRGQIRQLLAQLQPRGAFLGAGQSQPALSRLWFYVGLYILAGLVFAALCAHRAIHAGHSPAAWFGIGLVLNVFGYGLLLTCPKRDVRAPAGVPRGLRKVSATSAPQPCAKCGSLNHPCAETCSGCGAALEAKQLSEVARAGLRSV